MANFSAVSSSDSISNASTLRQSQIGGLDKSTMSVKIGRSELTHIYGKEIIIFAFIYLD